MLTSILILIAIVAAWDAANSRYKNYVYEALLCEHRYGFQPEQYGFIQDLKAAQWPLWARWVKYNQGGNNVTHIHHRAKKNG